MENIVLKEAIIMASTNSSNMCRLCLSANGITEPICYDQRDQFLLQKIYECTTLQISPLNGIPSSLCTICKARLDEFYQFRWQCIKNDEIIRRIADSLHSKQSDDSSATSPVGSSHVPSQNPKEELIDSHPAGGEMQQVPTVDEGSSSRYACPGEEERRIDERLAPVGYDEHPEHTMEARTHPVGYGLVEHGHHSHGQYVTGSNTLPYSGEQTHGYQPENKYPVAQQYEFSDFRRKRGRPPKQKYDLYHHPIVKYGESSIDGTKVHTVPAMLTQEPETILTYGEGSSRGSEYQHGPVYGGDWSPQTKIKLEQVEHQQVRYDDQEPARSPEAHDQKLLATSTVQTVLTPEGFVKRSRGRPPREGGCPNQDRTEYRFQCQYCDARFKAAINLKLHTNTHTGERPYKCQLCDKSFAHPSNLSVHTKLHTQERVKREGVQSEKKFQCPYCHTLFALAFQLKIHINTHTGQKPYVCKNCGKGFAQPSNLHVHIKKHCHKRVDYHDHQQPSEPSDQCHTPAHLEHQPNHNESMQQLHPTHHSHPAHMQHHPEVVPPHSPTSAIQLHQHSPHLQVSQAIAGHEATLPHAPQQTQHSVEQQPVDTPSVEKRQNSPPSQQPSHSEMELAPAMLV